MSMHSAWCLSSFPQPLGSNCRATEEYLADGTAVPVWPPPDVLKELAVDETVLVTAATCSYADLATNWIKHVWDLQIGCFLVAAADEPMSEFLGGWIPDHSAKMPADMVSKVGRRRHLSGHAATAPH